MIGSIPTDTPEEQAARGRLKQMTPAKIAPLAVCLASDAAKDVNGQIFAVRNNEIFLMSQPRPMRSVQRGEGWTPQSVAEHAHARAEGELLRRWIARPTCSAGTRYETRGHRQSPAHTDRRLWRRVAHRARG